MKKTKKLYDTAPYATEFTARVINTQTVAEGVDIVLDRTLFFPEEGGQSCDLGTLDGLTVTHVSVRDGVIFHRCQKLPEGETVTGGIDFPHRYRNMQNHSAEHIVSGLIFSLFSYNNVGFHLGSHDCTMDYDGVLTRDMLEEVEERANRAVYENLSITAEYPTRNALEKLSYRSKKVIEGAVRIVTVPGYDVCACCAPHVARTGEIGVIKLVSFERYKGGTRVYMHAGLDAVHDYRRKNTELSQIASFLSVQPSDAFQAVEKLSEENARLGRTVSQLQKTLCQALAQTISPGTPLYLRFFPPDELNGNGLRKLAEYALEKCRLAALFLETAPHQFQFLLASRNISTQAVFKTFQSVFPARGGGRGPFIQGTVSADEKELTDYFDALSL